MELIDTNVALTLVAVIMALYYLTTWRHDYWQKNGVAGPRPLPLFGHSAPFLFQQVPLPKVFQKYYQKWRHYPFFGLYNGQQPALIVNDLELVRRILVKDFHVFNGRGILVNEKADPLGAHIFAVDGPRWKYMRTKMTPIFTTGKLKHMFNFIRECADHFENYLREEINRNRIVECKEIFGRFTTDVIGSCAFGLNMNALNDEVSDFKKYGASVFRFDIRNLLKVFIREVAPWLYAFCQFRIFSQEVSKFFITSISETMETRRRENIVRNDLVDILIDIKENHDKEDFELTDSFLVAQAFLFFLAGFETSSSTIAFALYELAHRQDIQEKLRAEIVDFLKRHNGNITYETIKEMKYLEMVVHETLRRNPPVTQLKRRANMPYTIPDTDITLETGTLIIIPIYGIHFDNKYFSNPEIFDPERFTEQAKRLRHPMAYLPFGAGPKNCIGGRFGFHQVKLGIIKILKDYRVQPTKQSQMPYKIDKSVVFLSPQDGLELEFQPLH